MSVGEGLDWLEGEELAWRELAMQEPAEVCRNAGARCDTDSASYNVKVLGADILVCPESRSIQADSACGAFLLEELRHYSRLALLCYLARARDVPPSGKLVNPREVGGGLIFSLGAHRLPLDDIAERYGKDSEAFMRQGMMLGGEKAEYGDASLILHPFPRMPVAMILWMEDEEFPARAELLFDSTCVEQLPTDIIWSTAMLAVSAMLMR